ncbi:MAG: TPM domain-containing protein [Steroidobacteraceae bacterium]
MRPSRLLRHVTAAHWRTRRMFSASTLQAIEAAIGKAERTHAGEIRFVIETALSPRRVIAGLASRDRALQLFSELKVWDTHHNNGVLMYVLLADRAVEIVADRGLAERVGSSEWESVCRTMRDAFRAGHFREGSIAGIDAVGLLLARHFAPLGPGAVADNQLPDRPTLL